VHARRAARRKAILKLVKRIVHRGPDWSSLHADGENYLAHQARRPALRCRAGSVRNARRDGGGGVARRRAAEAQPAACPLPQRGQKVHTATA
jgi:hypothetical protein